MKQKINSKQLILVFTAVAFGILTGFNVNGIAADGLTSAITTAQSDETPGFAYNAKCGDGRSDANKTSDTQAKCGDGKCGDGKAAEKKSDSKDAKSVDAKSTDKKAEAKDTKCGDGKCGEGKPDTTKTAEKDARCGTGKCG